MVTESLTEPVSRPNNIDLGDGLLLRWSTPMDAENIAGCLAEAFRWVPLGASFEDHEEPKPNQWVKSGAMRLMSGDSKVMTPYDYAIVENTLAKPGKNPIVACVCLQTCLGYYGSTPIIYAKPEAVGSLPEYRSKGLIRSIFHEMIHPASEAQGHVIQIIPGIPHFYLQFGYEYAIGSRRARLFRDYEKQIPKRPEHEPKEPFHLRAPSLEDIPYLLSLSTSEKMFNHAGLGAYYTEDFWQFVVHIAPETAKTARDFERIVRIIVDEKTGKDAGVIMAAHRSNAIVVNLFSLSEGYSYRDSIYPALRLLIDHAKKPQEWEIRIAEEDAKAAKEAEATKESKESEDTQESKAEQDSEPKQPEERKIAMVGFSLDPKHPVMQLADSSLESHPNYFRLFTRINSYPDFLLKVRGTLEERLAKSSLAGISITFQIDFYRRIVGCTGRGIELVFEDGKLVKAHDWVPPTPEEKMHTARARIALAKEEGRPDTKPIVFKASFPPKSFTRLVVGDLSVDQMLSFYGDSEVEGTEAKLMLEILFPKQQFHFDLFWW
ncbi:hypothetical protein BGW38_004747 [Lunasporangiospora selenospora]|uniref:Uncharacterized protein n=1 Tax=Lunasporangiospora selenospora TaxID=979761 RepID=A0A9P6KGP6_9FUNG|nr:hypothetical protein BGW38_004747 [Lunasporangiospora selenospora]